MKLKRWMAALIITVVVLFLLEGIYSAHNRVNGLEMQVRELSTRVSNIKVPKIDVSEVQDSISEFDARLRDLDERVYQYQQDIDFWNEQVDNMFGVHNARYFREGRGLK